MSGTARRHTVTPPVGDFQVFESKFKGPCSLARIEQSRPAAVTLSWQDDLPSSWNVLELCGSGACMSPLHSGSVTAVAARGDCAYATALKFLLVPSRAASLVSRRPLWAKGSASRSRQEARGLWGSCYRLPSLRPGCLPAVQVQVRLFQTQFGACGCLHRERLASCSAVVRSRNLG